MFAHFILLDFLLGIGHCSCKPDPVPQNNSGQGAATALHAMPSTLPQPCSERPAALQVLLVQGRKHCAVARAKQAAW